ncbi:AraC family transcriptional regulator [Aeromonas diversa CDC 2478-85]|uniref:AraC family transcriptional regulator n=1 Tax=Aeromonas diversa CDC 2478-85 TaxID=1268237 RepID=N9VL99_9GAMM|nr:helix-turn-helix transcriptional regulator [Aeromonas diversa]ENY72398.1 AraC family transcriptional regulator [Aeromonas diversa CDC 2478-85]
MAFITPTTRFNPDLLTPPVIGIAADLGQHDSGRHHHARHQLLFANQGCITIELADTLCVLPPTRAAWIPAGTGHRALMRGVVAYRSLYFAQTAAPTLPLGVLEVNPLLREVIERMAFWPWDMTAQAQQSLLTVCEEELLAAPRQPWQLPFPRDARLAAWLDGVRGGALPERLNQLANRVAASERTLGRIFLRETGMSYQAWRQQWRLLRAMELLAESGSLSQTAQALDFASDSAFIAFFRQHTGQTPLRYLNHGAPPRC